MKQCKSLLITVLLLFLLTACSDLANQILGNTPTPEMPTATPESATATPEPTATAAIAAETITGLATVDSIEIQMLASFPVQVNVRARGDLPDGCTLIAQSNAARQGTTYTVAISTIRPAGSVCTQALVPFEELIPLDVVDLPAGTYTVDVNGITGSFTLDTANTLAVEPTATTPTDANNAIINGRIWHDLCTVIGGEGEEQVALSAGCVAVGDGTGFEANGKLEDGEPGLEGVLVSLGEGNCPSVGLATTLTDADGDYVFDGLAAGDYCVSVDEEVEDNVFLLPGNWTFPGIGQTVVTLTESEIKTDVNFGWDYQFLPESDIDLENCTNSMAFVTDLSIPDDTVIAPGADFEKGWRLRNSGTCPWTTGYSLVFAGGDQMGASTAVSLTSPVAPGQEVTLSVTLTAPETVGTYRSDWLLANSSGQLFGVDGFPDEVIWVQIVVGVPESTPEPNSAVIGGVVWEDICFIRADGTPSVGCVEIDGTGFYRGDGTLINEPRLAGITVILATGPCPDVGAPTPGTILQTAFTDENGLYRFPNLDEGLYCVAIDALSPANVNLLIPGNWTWPAPGTGAQGINLAAGEERLEVDFGWDYQE